MEEALRARAAINTYFRASLKAVAIRISEERGIPTASRGKIYLPLRRALLVTPEWDEDPVSITHEMTHLLGRGGRPDRMLIEGLAVHVNHQLGRPTYPNNGEDLDATTLRLQSELGRTLPLVESERFRKRGTREERRLAYTQEGSFAQYYIATYGLPAFLDLVAAKQDYEDEPALWARLEREWRASLEKDQATGREP